jgi:hypothetical protein
MQNNRKPFHLSDIITCFCDLWLTLLTANERARSTVLNEEQTDRYRHKNEELCHFVCVNDFNDLGITQDRPMQEVGERAPVYAFDIAWSAIHDRTVSDDL